MDLTSLTALVSLLETHGLTLSKLSLPDGTHIEVVQSTRSQGVLVTPAVSEDKPTPVTYADANPPTVVADFAGESFLARKAKTPRE